MRPRQHFYCPTSINYERNDMNHLHDKSVLIVDDDPGVLQAMKRVLAREGMQVTGLSDPLAGLKALADSPRRFDLLITDLRMPALSGRGVLGFASAARP